jgi:hypothetical protein
MGTVEPGRGPKFCLIKADARRIPLADGSVQCCITSPPYWGLRDYGVEGQIGIEPTPEDFVAAMVAVFREVRRVLRDDGTLWLNLGDSMNAYNGNRGKSTSFSAATEGAMPKLPKGHGLSTGEPVYELRDDLSDAERAYVLAELSKHLSGGRDDDR